jgi:hypothetical protein
MVWHLICPKECCNEVPSKREAKGLFAGYKANGQEIVLNSVLDSNKLALASNLNIEMKWWPRRGGTSRHIWVPVKRAKTLREPCGYDERECVATKPGVCPCGEVEWIGVAEPALALMLCWSKSQAWLLSPTKTSLKIDAAAALSFAILAAEKYGQARESDQMKLYAAPTRVICIGLAGFW